MVPQSTPKQTTGTYPISRMAENRVRPGFRGSSAGRDDDLHGVAQRGFVDRVGGLRCGRPRGRVAWGRTDDGIELRARHDARATAVLAGNRDAGETSRGVEDGTAMGVVHIQRERTAIIDGCA